MKPFRATLRDYNAENPQSVVVIEFTTLTDGPPIAIYVDAVDVNAKLDFAPITRFSECQIEWPKMGC